MYFQALQNKTTFNWNRNWDWWFYQDKNASCMMVALKSWTMNFYHSSAIVTFALYARILFTKQLKNTYSQIHDSKIASCHNRLNCEILIHNSEWYLIIIKNYMIPPTFHKYIIFELRAAVAWESSFNHSLTQKIQWRKRHLLAENLFRTKRN